MTELIADLPYRVVDAAGGEYYASVAGEQRADGVWDGWLEFVPTDESDAFVTDVETTQSTRADLVHWADTLTETYVQGSFSRAVAATTGSRLVTRKVDIEPLPISPTTEVPIGLEDPFELYAGGGKAGLRARLVTLPRATLLAIIDAFGLNPARKSLAWLSQPQLITFIATATEVQVTSGTRAD